MNIVKQFQEIPTTCISDVMEGLKVLLQILEENIKKRKISSDPWS